MRNITLSAQEDLIDKARRVAERQNRSLNDLFRDWLLRLSRDETDVPQAERLQQTFEEIGNLGHIPRYTRDEMNARR